MDKAILKKFAIESRQDLIDKIKNKINTFYIDEEFQSEQKGDLYILSNDKHTLSLTNDEYKKRELLIKRINELGIEQVIEEVAYTWFNRIVAIRYMEINDYLPLTKDNQSLGIRVLSSKDNTPDPEILKFTNLTNPDLDIDFKKGKYAELKDDNEKFKYVLLLVCKKLGRVIPQVFDGITDYIDILIPDNLLNDTGFVNKIVSEVPENNYNQVEIIGWLYQYYNQTEKDRVISAKKAYKKNEIAYATQLFTPDWIVKYMEELNIMSIQESNKISDTVLDNLNSEEEKELGIYLIERFKNAKEIGSLLILEKKDYSLLEQAMYKNNTIFGIELREKINPLIKLAKIIQNKYNIVVTNPPYMNNSVMSLNLKNYIQENYKSVKSDLFSSFIMRNSFYGNEDSYLGFMTPYVWMFISSYEDLRKYIIEKINISSLIQLEYSALEEATVPICSFVLNNKNSDIKGTYFRLTDFTGGMQIQEMKYLDILNNNSEYKFIKNSKDFMNIPGFPISYWLSKNVYDNFKNFQSLFNYFEVKSGISPGNTEKFLKLWYEVEIKNIHFTNTNTNKEKWYPTNKGGPYRKWYGNRQYVMNWKNNGYEIINYIDDNGKQLSFPRNLELQLKEHIGYSRITSGNQSFRFFDNGYLFTDSSAAIIGSKNVSAKYLLGLLNTKIVMYVLNAINPTLNTQAGDICKLPLKVECNNKVVELVNECLSISQEDWDSFETSWDFITHPLIEYKTGSGYDKDIYKWDYKIKDVYESWKSNCDEKFKLLKNNEEELNKIFIDIYGLQDELTYDVEDKDITIRKADREREIKSLISYAVGCMFGRYSLDQDGLVYAGGDFDKSKYKTFSVDEDNIIPITDEAYFGDDIVERFKKFIKVVYGDNTFNENMDFIAETLGKKGTETSEDTIRRYFLNDFFNDHVKTYKKRPIYWLFDSGKKNGFKALVYMHRFNENLIPKVRLDYLHRVQTTYEKLLSDVNYKLTTELSLSDKKTVQNRQANLNAKLNEIKEYDEKIAHIANQRINIDLDDGVKVNYDKFKDIFAKIK